MTVSRAIGWEMEGMPRIVRGVGSYLFDSAGRRYLDGSGGPAAFCLGHGNPEVNAAITEQLAQFPAQARDQVLVLFSAHSLPEKIQAAGDPYPQQLKESADGIAALLGLKDWRFCYQSAGMTGEPWLGPDILDYLDELHAEGVRYVLSAPFGFVAEHLEVLWDIDTEAQQKAGELGMTLRRIRMPNADPEFVEVIRAVVSEKVSQEQIGVAN